MVSFCKFKKRWYLGAVVILTIALYATENGYNNGYNKEYSESLGSNFEDNSYNDEIRQNSQNDYSKREVQIGSKSVWASSDDKIETTTKITTISVDSNNNELEKNSGLAPNAYVGFTKMQLAKFYEHYIMNKPIEEMEKGLLSIDIVSFSKDEVVVNKLYDKANVTYFVTEDDGLVKVYYSDRETLYENTGISVADLPDIEQKSIKLGMMVEDKDELISILEGYSS